MNEISEETKYLSIDQVAQLLACNKATVWQWIKVLELQTYRFIRNRRTWLAVDDVKRLKELKEKPWMMKEKKASNGTTPR